MHRPDTTQPRGSRLSPIVAVLLSGCDATSQPAAWAPDNVFRAINGPAKISSGLRVEPCEGTAPMLCIDFGTALRLVGELVVYPRSGRPELESFREEGDDDAVLKGFASEHLETIEIDRRGAHGQETRFVRMAGEAVRVGALHGWRYGYTIVAADGGPVERHVTFAALDAEVLYVIAVPFEADRLSDDAFERILPDLTEVIFELRLPAPVAESDVPTVEILGDGVAASVVYGEGVLGAVPRSATLLVTGRSHDGRFWRVRCPDQALRECWVPADPDRVRPSTKPRKEDPR